MFKQKNAKNNIELEKARAENSLHSVNLKN